MSSLEQGKASLTVCSFSGMPLPRWYAIYTRPRHEKQVSTALQKSGLTVFLPLLDEEHRWSDRRKKVQLPLFPGYLFLRAAISSHFRLSVLQTPGVLGFVACRGEALPVCDEEIDGIRRILVEKIPFTPCPFVRIGQRVRIRGGVLDGLEGILVQPDREGSLVVSLTMTQRSVAIRLAGYCVVPA